MCTFFKSQWDKIKKGLEIIVGRINNFTLSYISNIVILCKVKLFQILQWKKNNNLFTFPPSLYCLNIPLKCDLSLFFSCSYLVMFFSSSLLLIQWGVQWFQQSAGKCSGWVHAVTDKQGVGIELVFWFGCCWVRDAKEWRCPFLLLGSTHIHIFTPTHNAQLKSMCSHQYTSSI